MSNVEFDTDSQAINYAYQQQMNPKPHGGITGLIIKMKLANDEAGAKAVLIGIFIVNILITGFVLFYYIL